MTILALLLGTIVSEVLFVLTKVIFINYLDIDNFIVKVSYFVVLIIITTAVIRRMGVINYLECFFTAILWFIVMILVDMSITSYLIGKDMFSHIYFWLSYLAVVLAVILFHKALHVEVRRGNIAKM